MKQCCEKQKHIYTVCDLHPSEDCPACNHPMGASQWKAYGLKYGYWNFFETEIRKDWEEEKKEVLKEI